MFLIPWLLRKYIELVIVFSKRKDIRRIIDLGLLSRKVFEFIQSWFICKPTVKVY